MNENAYEQVKVFSSTCSIEFVMGDDINRSLTMNIQAAPLKKAGSADTYNTYDYEKSLRLQLSLEEMISFCSVILGTKKDLRIRNHGTSESRGDRKKSCRIARQKENFYFSIDDGFSNDMGLPITNEKIVLIGSSLIKAISKRLDLQPESTLTLIRGATWPRAS